MASIHREENKPNWFCHYYDPEGYRRKRSTGTTNEKIANTICLNVERAADLTRDGRLTNEKGLKLVRETCTAIGETHGKLAATRAESVLKSAVEEFIRIGGGEFTSYTVRSWFNTWMDGRTEASKATIVAYRRVVDMFLAHLGARADRALTMLEQRQVEEFKGYLKKRVAPSTVNLGVKVVKSALNAAVKSRQLDFNPAQHVGKMQTESAGRRPFTDAELSALLTHAIADWRTMILTAFYTGLRLNDCANLTWRNIELHTNTLNVVTEKTGRRQVLQLAEPLARHLSTIAGDNPDAPLCPTLHGKPKPSLSGQFYALMVKAGIVEARDHKSKGKGRDAKRESNPVSFHSLRYNCTSALKSAGVSDSVAMDIVGHETASISRNYTKIDDTAKRDAVNKLPDITK
ncbi:MAG: tyrosine-type recombinase/integrase [Verrucomicrobiota bacterium]